MNINVFWNKAIEHYCIAGKPEGSSIFIPISENALEFIYSGFLKQIEYDDRIYIEKIVSKSGSINKSYYSASIMSFIENHSFYFNYFIGIVSIRS